MPSGETDHTGARGLGTQNRQHTRIEHDIPGQARGAGHSKRAGAVKHQAASPGEAAGDRIGLARVGSENRGGAGIDGECGLHRDAVAEAHLRAGAHPRRRADPEARELDNAAGEVEPVGQRRAGYGG